MKNNAVHALSVRELVPGSTRALLLVAWLVVGVFFTVGGSWLAAPLNPVGAACIFAILFITIVAASFGVVREADHLAHQLGEPYGTLILTLSIVAIEVILIASMLLGPGEAPTIGRDSIFAVMMIIMNLVMGICLIAGAARNGDQEYNAQGAVTYISMILLLTGTALVLPKFTSGLGEFTSSQAVAISVLTAVLYAAFLWAQMGSQRRYFVQPAPGMMVVPASEPEAVGDEVGGAGSIDRKAVIVRSIVLIAMILPIVLLAHFLAIVMDYGVAAAGLPAAVSGVLIAIIVFTPESITAVKAAMNNEMQRTINLCHGAFVSTVGLTVPAVLVIGLITGKQVIMGISMTEVVLLALTIALSMKTLNGQKTSPIQGYMHILLFTVFALLLFMP